MEIKEREEPEQVGAFSMWGGSLPTGQNGEEKNPNFPARFARKENGGGEEKPERQRSVSMLHL